MFLEARKRKTFNTGNDRIFMNSLVYALQIDNTLWYTLSFGF